MLVEMVDNSVLNIALPTIGRDLHAGPSDLQWIVGAYSLTFGGLLMVGGTLGDRLGRKRALLWGLIGFGLSGLLVLLVHDTAQLIAVRALSGAFAALIAPGTMSLTFRLFDDTKLRGKAIGLIVSVAMTGFAVGPVLSGLAIAHLSWHVLLVINAPVAAIAYLGVRRGIADDDPADLRSGGSDIPGAVLSVATLGLGLYTFTAGAEQGWLSWPTVVCALGAIAAGYAFVRRERSTSDPMLDLRLLRRPTVRGAALMQTAVTVATVGVMFAATEIFQFAWGWSPLRTGFATLPMVAGMFLGAPVSDWLVERAGHRRVAAVGAGILIASLIGITFTIDHGYLSFAIGMLTLTVGLRMVMTTCAIELIGALPEDHTSIGSAMNDTAQELGNAVGVAIVGTVTAAVVGTVLPTGAWSAHLVHDFFHAVQLSFGILAVVATVVSIMGVRRLSNATTLEE